MNNLSMEILVGPIASGKSSYCKSKAKQDYLIVNDDAIVNMLHAEIYTKYSKELKPLYKQIENTIIYTGFSLNRSIIIDRPNFKRETRIRYINIARSIGIKNIYCIRFKDEGLEEHSSRRFNSDSRGYSKEYWESVYRYQKSKFEEPSLSEGYKEIKEYVYVK